MNYIKTGTCSLRNSTVFIFMLFVVVNYLSACKSADKAGYKHKGYLGWLTDLSTTERLGQPWPSIEIDSSLLRDYEETLTFLEQNGMNEITIWGLFTSTSWEPEIEKTIDDTRKQLIKNIIEKAHKRGIKVINGVGVYSWGFNKIIETHPEVRCACNNELMDLAKEEAWQWQKKVLDYILNTYDFDGMSLQSADRGICKCGDNASVTDMEYHALVNQKVVDYVRTKRKNYILGISGWGMNLSDSINLNSIVKLTKNVDYLIDVYESALTTGAVYRKDLIKAIAPCSYGNTGTPNVEPIMALPRDYYFVPTIQRTATRIKQLYADGGRACEMYYRTLSNPGDQLTALVSARLLNDPSLDITKTATEIIAKAYGIKDASSAEKLVSIFFEAEDAYFTYGVGDKEIILLIPRDAVSPSIQYYKAMPKHSQKLYKAKMKFLYESALSLNSSTGNQVAYANLIECFKTVIGEMDKVGD